MGAEQSIPDQSFEHSYSARSLHERKSPAKPKPRLPSPPRNISSSFRDKDEHSDLSDPDPEPDFELNIGNNNLLTIFKTYQSSLHPPDKIINPSEPILLESAQSLGEIE
jgi:hypothetical protein